MTTEIGLRPMAAPVTTAAGTRILEAASDLFYGQGINRTGVDLIAERAEVTKRTLYQRFGSKERLVAAYLELRAHRWQSAVLAEVGGLVGEPRDAERHDALGTHGDETDRVAILEAVYALAGQWSAAQGRGCAFVNAWVEAGPEAHAAIEVIRAEKAWMRALFRVIAPNPTTAETLYLLYEGAQVAASLETSTEPLEAACRVSRTLL